MKQVKSMGFDEVSGPGGFYMVLKVLICPLLNVPKVTILIIYIANMSLNRTEWAL